MKKSRVYTKTGDKGTTGLVSGTRVSKGDERLNLYGEVDELNSHIGLAYRFLRDEGAFKEELELIHRIQSALFDLGSNLACEGEKRRRLRLPYLDETLVSDMETSIDKLDGRLTPIKHFILPGGSLAGAQFHVCRTVTRRVERRLINYQTDFPDEIPQDGLIFLNRLSDYFFILSRYANHLQKEEELKWIAKRED